MLAGQLRWYSHFDVEITSIVHQDQNLWSNAGPCGLWRPNSRVQLLSIFLLQAGFQQWFLPKIYIIWYQNYRHVDYWIVCNLSSTKLNGLQFCDRVLKGATYKLD